ncbi:DAXX protein, partial [Alcedo cyanopectus]|nr:DAXX protein [Ceyx cyanopectus]
LHPPPTPLPPPPSPSQSVLPRLTPLCLSPSPRRRRRQFVCVCSRLTREHPEVVPFLRGRQQRAAGPFLGSAELRNVLSRCLARVRGRPTKVYVYINELCTVLKAHAPRRKIPLEAPGETPNASGPGAASASGPGAGPGASSGPGAAAGASSAAPGAAPASAPASGSSSTPGSASASSPQPGSGSHCGSGSKRQIRYLENLLRVYTGEIRRLQEKELDLAELDSEDSPYLQESRLKRRMMRIFQRLCQLKSCSSLTGRVIEQRIPYRGTRYPEVNRRIERFINRPDAFPDYGDILKVIQRASQRHGLGLPRRHMENMAQDAFREVGNRLQERRHLDLVYNFGSHLTDQYRPG